MEEIKIYCDRCGADISKKIFDKYSIPYKKGFYFSDFDIQIKQIDLCESCSLLFTDMCKDFLDKNDGLLHPYVQRKRDIISGKVKL